MDSKEHEDQPHAESAARDVTLLLQSIAAGNEGAWEDLLARIGAELESLARLQMARERRGHVLETNALVNEAFLRLVGSSDDAPQRGYENREHFFRAAATAMRRILVDEARRRKSLKRGGEHEPVTFSQIVSPTEHASGAFDDVESLNLALGRFEAVPDQQRKCKIVELRFFVGLSLEEAAEVLGVSLASVKRDWSFARAWLRREIERTARAG